MRGMEFSLWRERTRKAIAGGRQQHLRLSIDGDHDHNIIRFNHNYHESGRLSHVKHSHGSSFLLGGAWKEK